MSADSIRRNFTNFLDHNRKLPEGASAIGYRVLSIALSIFFFALYSKVIFILFMGHEGFFSYDLLTTGTFGLEVFFFTTELILVFFSVVMFGVLIPALKYPLCRKFVWADWAMAVIFLALNILMWFRLFPAVMHTPNNEMGAWFVLAALSLLICIHLSVMFYCPPEVGLKSLMVVLLGLTALTLVAHEEMASLLQFGLKHFGVGGEIPVTIKLRDPGAENMSARLVLLSPDHAYVVLERDTNLAIVPRSIIEIIKLPSGKVLLK